MRVNTTVIGSLVSTFACPSDLPPPVVNNDTVNGAGWAYSRHAARRSNYLLCSSRFTEYDCAANYNNTPPADRGMFFTDFSTGFQEVVDGLSNTCMVAESRQEHWSADYGPYWGNGCHTSTHGVVYPPTHVWSPNSVPNAPWPLNPPFNGLGYAWRLSSRHPGGINMTFGDGSVRFIKNTVNPYTWWALQTIGKNEVVSSDAY